MAERHDHRPGQGGEVDHHLRLQVALGPGHGVRQHEPSFGVGIDHLDRLSRHRGHDVAGPLGVAVRHVLGEGADADDIGFRLAARQGPHRPGDRTGTPHVPLHRFHARSGLDRYSTGIEGDALADQDDRLRLRARGAVPAHDEQTRRPNGSLGDAQKGAHPQLLHRGFVENLEFDAQPLHLLAAARDEGLRIDDVGRLGDEASSELQPVEQSLLTRPGAFDAVAGADDDHLFQRRLLLAAKLRSIMIVAPASRGGSEADPRRGIGIESEACQIDDQAGLSGEQELGGQRPADALVKRILVALASEPGQEQATNTVSLVDEGFGDRCGFTLESLRFRRSHRQRSRRFAQGSEPLMEHVFAPNRNGERISPIRALRGETDLDH